MNIHFNSLWLFFNWTDKTNGRIYKHASEFPRGEDHGHIQRFVVKRVPSENPRELENTDTPENPRELKDTDTSKYPRELKDTDTPEN